MPQHVVGPIAPSYNMLWWYRIPDAREVLIRVLIRVLQFRTIRIPIAGRDGWEQAARRSAEVRGTTRMPVERRDVLGGLIHEYGWAA